MKLLSSILLFALAFNLFAADTVRINDPANLVVTGSTNASFTLGSDAPSGDATAEAAPARVYLPIKSGIANQLDYSTLKLTSGLTSLYDITLSSHYVTFPLLLTVGGTQKYLYVAVRGGASGSSYYVSRSSGATIYSNQTNALVNFSINPKDICKSVILNNISTVCNATTGALDPLSTSPVLFKPMLYFFLTDQVLAVDGSSVVDPANASFSGGVYFEAQMSNRIFDSTSIIVSINDLRKGDGRVIGTFSASSTMDTSLFRKVIVYKYVDANTAVNINQSVGAAALANPGSILSNDISTAQSGEFTLSGLPNSYRVNISLAFEDKFLFATTLSTSRSEVPTEIQELLKKQACYLLTAGFGEEHYVITFFRGYRDQILANSWLGKQFIKVYYRSAPHYAVIIYRSEWMRLAIRSMAYTLYFFFNYYWLVLIFLVSCLFLNLWKNKILLQKNSL